MIKFHTKPQMKTIAITLIFFLLLSCSSLVNKTESKADYFEGLITSKVEFQPYSENFSSTQLTELFGNKTVLSFKNGNFRKQYFSPSGKLLRESYLDLIENKFYTKIHDSDTILWIDITKNDSETIFNTINDTTLLNQSAIGIVTKTEVNMAMYPNKTFHVSGTYYFSKKYKVNPNWYKNYKEGNFNEIITEGKGLQLLSINNGIFWTEISKVVELTPQVVNLETITIKLDKTSILKEL